MRIWYLKVTRFISVCLCFSRTCVNVVSRCERMNLGRLFWRIIHSTQSSLLLLKIAKEVLAKLGWAISRLLVRRPRERASEWLVGLAVQRNVCGQQWLHFYHMLAAAAAAEWRDWAMIGASNIRAAVVTLAPPALPRVCRPPPPACACCFYTLYLVVPVLQCALCCVVACVCDVAWRRWELNGCISVWCDDHRWPPSPAVASLDQWPPTKQRDKSFRFMSCCCCCCCLSTWL